MTTATSNKWGLLIGVDTYPLLEPRYQLHGCVNDNELMADLLQHKFGFMPEKITKLTNEQATRTAILAAMDSLVKRVQTNDIVVIHYSGHGSQRTDGSERDEPDGLDETIVPHDSGRNPHPNLDISDDEIYLRLLELSKITPYLTFIFDCCHSGTITRDPFGGASRWVEPDLRPASVFPPLEIPPDIARDLQEGKRDIGPSGWLPLGKRYVLIAGCQDNESSYEYQGGGVQHGALTYFLAEELYKATSDATYRDVFEPAGSHVTAELPRQHPQMEGARDRELFGIREIAPMRFVAVKQRMGDQVMLAAGAAHGMTIGSQWAIYPSTTKQATATSQALGRVEITAVHAVTSEAKLLVETNANTIVANTRAVEDAHFYGQMQLSVEIQTATAYTNEQKELEKLIKESTLLHLAQTGEKGDVRIYVLPIRTQVNAGDPVPQLATINEPIWAIVGRDGMLLLPVHPIKEVGAAMAVRDNLEKRARYEQALQLRNPNPASDLKDKVEFTLLCQKADRSWEEAQPIEPKHGQTVGAGQIIYEAGECIAVRIVNHHTAPVYVSVLDFGLTGALSLLHPPAGASEPLGPGRSMEIGVRTGDEIALYMPDNFPYTPDPKDNESPVGGCETFKLFVTTHEADFSQLVQGGYRGIEDNCRGSKETQAKGAGTPLGQLLDMALTGQGTRDVRRTQVSPDEEWTTVERSFFLRRKML